MADMLPRFMVIRSVTSGGYAYYMNENNELRGFVRCQGESVFIPSAKIEVERATTGNNFVHLRFCYSNKYWARLGPGVNDRWIVASSSQPEEDISKSTCTLFEPRIGNEGRLFLTHIQTGRRVRVDWGSAATITSSRAFVDDRNQGDSFSGYALNFVDWETLVKMPNRVAFKGYNGKYLKSKVVQRLPYLEFSSDDGNEKAVAFEIRLNPDGHIRIKSDHFGRFWRRSPNWIWADADDNNNRSVDTLFWPVKIDHHTIALRNAGNNNFCKSLSVDRKTNCLNAAVSYITREARLVVEELVSDRNIYNVRYRMEDARIFDEKPFLAGIGVADNDSDVESTLTISVSYEDTLSYSFTNNLSLNTGVRTTIQTGVPKIVEGRIEVSTAVTNSFQWEKATTETRAAQATYTVTVPPRSRARVNYVGTHGNCSIPFSYTQRDKNSSNGEFLTSQNSDGVFTGVNYYSFRFEQLKVERR